MSNIDEEREIAWADGPYDTEEDAEAAAIAYANSRPWPTERVFAERREDGYWDAVVWFAEEGSTDDVPPGVTPEPAPVEPPSFPWWILLAAGSLFFL